MLAAGGWIDETRLPSRSRSLRFGLGIQSADERGRLEVALELGAQAREAAPPPDAPGSRLDVLDVAIGQERLDPHDPLARE